jgi:two-component sensor histidine kinase
MIASILNIQARRSKQPEVKKILKENISRVLSVASIHDILTQNELENQLSVKKIIEKVRDNIIICLYNKYIKIEIVVEGDDFLVSSSKASSIAIVVNELITNAYEHAFQNRSEGKITVTLNHGNKYSSVTVADDGTGFEIPEKGSSGFGLDLARMTVEDKLKGKIQFFSSAEGSKISFDFNN